MNTFEKFLINRNKSGNRFVRHNIDANKVISFSIEKGIFPQVDEKFILNFQKLNSKFKPKLINSTYYVDKSIFMHYFRSYITRVQKACDFYFSVKLPSKVTLFISRYINKIIRRVYLSQQRVSKPSRPQKLNPKKKLSKLLENAEKWKNSISNPTVSTSEIKPISFQSSEILEPEKILEYKSSSKASDPEYQPFDPIETLHVRRDMRSNFNIFNSIVSRSRSQTEGLSYYRIEIYFTDFFYNKFSDFRKLINNYEIKSRKYDKHSLVEYIKLPISYFKNYDFKFNYNNSEENWLFSDAFTNPCQYGIEEFYVYVELSEFTKVFFYNTKLSENILNFYLIRDKQYSKLTLYFEAEDLISRRYYLDATTTIGMTIPSQIEPISRAPLLLVNKYITQDYDMFINLYNMYYDLIRLFQKNSEINFNSFNESYFSKNVPSMYIRSDLTPISQFLYYLQLSDSLYSYLKFHSLLDDSDHLLDQLTIQDHFNQLFE